MGSLIEVRKPPHNHCFGLEVECIPTSHWNKDFKGFWFETSDGSLPRDGREYISQPMPYNMARQQLRKLWVYLDGWRVTDACGLHIHVSRGMWDKKREEAFSVFLRTLTSEQIIELFGRTSDYARVGDAASSKYRAINLRHKNTYEFRLWKAGDLDWTLECLRRTRIIVRYKGNYDYETLLKLFAYTPLADLFIGPPKPNEVSRIGAVHRARGWSISQAWRWIRNQTQPPDSDSFLDTRSEDVNQSNTGPRPVPDNVGEEGRSPARDASNSQGWRALGDIAGDADWYSVQLIRQRIGP